ncbi:MAG: phosphotransferase [Candidatus Heimdallarchaeota archaeon]|nr:phosphotransferase [Candidatus Heimdallarchaeota archaeon]
MSFYEETNPADISVEEILPHLRLFLPDIRKANIRFFYHGTYNVFEINRKFILRVADEAFRNKSGLAMLEKEAKILSFLQNRFDVSFPEILYIHNSPTVPFSIHRKIPGKSLVFLFQELSSKQITTIGTAIGRFLSNFHSEELLTAFLETFPEFDPLSQGLGHFMKDFKLFWTSRYEKAKSIAYSYLSHEQQTWLTQIFLDYLNDEENFSFLPRITHCDFDTSNILIDPHTAHLTGIIDFEDCQIYDPAVDLLFYDEGPEFMNALFANYHYSDQKSLQQRMKFFYCRTCVPYLVWGTTHNRPGMIEEGLRRIEKNMKMFPK